MLGRAFEAGLPLLDGGARDALVNRLVDDWHARVAGVGAFLLGFLSDMAASVATPLIKMRRGPLFEGRQSSGRRHPSLSVTGRANSRVHSQVYR